MSAMTRHAVVAELGLVVALVVHLVELDEARGGEAAAPGVEQLCDIAVEGAEQQVVEAVAVEIVDLRGYPVAFHAEDAYLHELRGVEPALVAVEHQQFSLVGAADEVAVAVAVQVAVVGHDLPGEAGVHQRAHGSNLRSPRPRKRYTLPSPAPQMMSDSPSPS